MSPWNCRTRVLTAIALSSLLVVFVAAAALANTAPDSERTSSGIAAQTGSVHDFDYFMGSGWITHQHKLKARGVGSKDWEKFTGYLCATPYLGGMATVDELYFPSKNSSGLTLRTFDLAKQQWSIYWVSSRDGKLELNPEVGGFKDNLGVFYGKDTDDKGRPVTVRFLWKIADHDHAGWEQAFSWDGGRTWETNWTADFVRADRSRICQDNRPKHSF